MRDVYNREAKLAYWIERVKHDKELLDEDRQDILGFVNFMQENERSALWVIRCITILLQIRRMLDAKKTFRTAEKQDIKKVLEFMEQKDYKPSTHEKFRIVLKLFYKAMYGNNEFFPDNIKWVKRKVSKDHYRQSEKLNHEQYLTEDELANMINNAPTLQKKALLATGYECGARPEELLSLRIRDIVFDDRGAVIILRGKTGERRVRIVAYAALLQQWINNGHPKNNDKNSYLWLSEAANNKHEPLGLWGAEKTIAEATRKAKITKRPRLYILRHSRATHLASHLKEAQMWAYFGWVPGTKVVQRYIHLSGSDVDGAILEAYGLSDQKKQTAPTLTPKKCLRCKELMSPNMEYCPRCSLPVDVKVVYEGSDERSKGIEEKMERMERLFNAVLSKLDPQMTKGLSLEIARSL